ncbi:MAG TPA: pentapeptide repeat-containing protein [Methanocorpusculum sp.]|nr:pentapeptide repeat-containing protein [Methanocorpusculum sp.]
MSFRNVIAVLILAAALLIIPAAADDSSPVLPMQLTGSAADADGDPLPAGTVITATVDGITSTYVVKENGKIGEPGTFGEKFLITGKTDTSQIVFTVNGIESEQTLPFKSGSSVASQTLTFNAAVEKEPADDNPSSGNSGTDNPGTGNTGTGNAGTGNSGVQNPAAEVTKTPAAEQTKTAEPAQTAQQTQAPAVSDITPVQTQASTPAPFIGIIAGLTAAAVFFGMRRK